SARVHAPRPSMNPDDLPLIAQGYRLSQALYAACALRLPDAVAGGARAAGELAEIVGAHPDRLRRLLRALAAEGLFTEDADGRFGPTPASARLTGESEDRLMVLGWRVLPATYAAFGHLTEAVRTGESAFEIAHGRAFYEHLAVDATAARAYDAATGSTADAFLEMAGVYDFGRHSVVVDVGGGEGGFLVSVLRSHHHLRGVLFDRPAVVATVAERIAREGVADRLEIVGGDAFESVPSGADLYITCTVLRCFDDHDCARLLRSIRTAIPPRGRILAFEQLVPDGPAQRPTAMLDVHTMVAYGGRDRTRGEYASLYAEAGFTLLDAIPAGGPFAGFLGEAT
ncbi:MAG TPA: methyltransferase, partial [Candidatus Dormibacteraeota bacterium]|nr:methyltransferase [Candidatus Dormibacteraeota bacterium]